MSLLIEQAGGRGYALTDDGDSTPETELEILGWRYADVFYAYLYARIVAVGENMDVPIVCPRCQFQGFLQANLWNTEVNVIDEPEEMFAWVDLKRGFKLKNSKLCKRIQLKPIPFSAQITPGASEVGVDVLGYQQFREGIAAIDGADPGYVISDEEIDEIEKIDQLAIDRQAGKVVAGPKLRTIIDCPGKNAAGESCGYKLIDGINWSFDHFFDSSVPLETLMP